MFIDDLSPSLTVALQLCDLDVPPPRRCRRSAEGEGHRGGVPADPANVHIHCRIKKIIEWERGYLNKKGLRRRCLSLTVLPRVLSTNGGSYFAR